MNNKRFFSAALSSFFAFALAAGVVTFTSKTQSRGSSTHLKNKNSLSVTQKSAKIYGEDGDWGSSYFNDSTEVEIERKDFTADFTKLTSTNVSKSAVVTFNSTRIVGWAPNDKSIYIIIDDADFSGDRSNPSLSNTPNPVFNAYTVECDPGQDKWQVIKTYKESGSEDPDLQRTKIIIPKELTYGNSFTIANHRLPKDSIVLKELDTNYDSMTDENKAKERAKYPNCILIPSGITEIEAGAIKNVPSFVEIQVQDSDVPAGWEAGWTDGTNITMGYDPHVPGGNVPKKSTDETKLISRATGLEEKNYGRLEKMMHAGHFFAVMDDPDWTGDYAAPSKTSNTGPYALDAFLNRVELTEEDVYLPTTVTFSDITATINTLGDGSIAFPSSDFDTFKYYCPEHDERLANDAAKSAHATAHPECKYQILNIPSYKSFFDTNPDVYAFIKEDEVAAAEEAGHVVRTVWNKDYVGPVHNLYIPEDIPFVNRTSFSNVPREITIKCEPANKEAAPAGWVSGFESYASIEWDAAIPAGKKTIEATDVATETRLSNDPTTWIVGYKYTPQDKYYCPTCKRYLTEEEKDSHAHAHVVIEDLTPEINKPLVIEYDVRHADSSVTKVWHEMPLLSEEETASSVGNYYDPVQRSSLDRYFDFIPEEGDTLIEDSIVVHNIFRSKVVKKNIKAVDALTGEVVDKVATFTVPDTSVAFKMSATKRYKAEVNIDKLVKYRFAGVSKFANYSMISMKMDKVLPSYWYDGVDPVAKESLVKAINRGEYSLRYALYNMTSSFYRITYKSSQTGLEVRKTIRVESPNPHYPLEKTKGNQIGFLIKNSWVGKDFKLSNMKKFELLGLTVNIHCWDNEVHSVVTKGQVATHFGAIEVMPYRASVGIFNIGLFVILFLIFSAVLYAAGSVGLFFFVKNKFKNDEFRRIKPKVFFKNAAIGLIGFIIVLTSILFIIFRKTKFDNFVAVHNPLDVFIIIPGIIALIFVGYFIKFLAGKHKANKERKKALKLKLNEDVADDGTN